MASRPWRFVTEYDGTDPYDVHLVLQVPMLSGKAIHLTELHNTTITVMIMRDHHGHMHS